MVKCENCGKEISLKTAVCDCGEPNARYAQENSDSIKEQGEINKFRKCKKGHHVNLNQYTDFCPNNCGEAIEPEVYSSCKECGNEVLDGNIMCEKCAVPEQYRTCPFCKSRNRLDATVCCKCADVLEGEKAAQSQQQLLRPRLICRQNTANEFEFEIKDGDIIGNGSHESASSILSNHSYIDLSCLNNTYISGKHASFAYQDGTWFICDEGSTNGTKVGLRPITPAKKVPIKNEEKIILANELFIFRVA